MSLNKKIKNILKIQIASVVLFTSSFAFATNSGDSSNNSGASVNTAATSTQSSNSSGRTMAMVSAGLLGYASYRAFAVKNYPMGAMFAIMAVLALKQSKEHGAVANMAGSTADNTNGNGTGTDTANATGSFSGLGPIADPNNKTGARVTTSGKVVTPDGKVYDPEKFGSQSSFSAAGFSPDQIAQAMAMADKINKSAAEKVKLGAMTGANGYEEGGGGGGSVVTGSEDPALAAQGVAGLGKKKEREPADVSGMTKNFNGEPIGVAADSIFVMMTRRYQVKDTQNAFINELDLMLKQK